MSIYYGYIGSSYGLSDSVIAGSIFVSPTGSDSGAGTEASPYLTLQKGITMASAGQTVYVRGGTHTAKCRIDNKSGTSGSRITIRNYPGEWPVFDGTAATGQDGMLEFHGCTYLDFQSFEVKNYNGRPSGTNSMGISCQAGCNYNTFTNIYAHDNHGVGIKVIDSCNSNSFINCTAYNNWDRTNEDASDGFAAEGGSVGNYYYYCLADSNSGDGYDNFGSGGNICVDCVAYNNGWQSGGYMGNGFKAGNTTTSGLCTFIGCISSGNRANGFSDNGSTTNSWFYNCTAHNNGDAGAGRGGNWDTHNATPTLHTITNCLDVDPQAVVGASGAVVVANVTTCYGRIFGSGTNSVTAGDFETVNFANLNSTVSGARYFYPTGSNAIAHIIGKGTTGTNLSPDLGAVQVQSESMSTAPTVTYKTGGNAYPASVSSQATASVSISAGARVMVVAAIETPTNNGTPLSCSWTGGTPAGATAFSTARNNVSAGATTFACVIFTATCTNAYTGTFTIGVPNVAGTASLCWAVWQVTGDSGIGSASLASVNRTSTASGNNQGTVSSVSAYSQVVGGVFNFSGGFSGTTFTAVTGSTRDYSGSPTSADFLVANHLTSGTTVAGNVTFGCNEGSTAGFWMISAVEILGIVDVPVYYVPPECDARPRPPWNPPRSFTIAPIGANRDLVVVPVCPVPPVLPGRQPRPPWVPERTLRVTVERPPITIPATLYPPDADSDTGTPSGNNITLTNASQVAYRVTSATGGNVTISTTLTSTATIGTVEVLVDGVVVGTWTYGVP